MPNLTTHIVIGKEYIKNHKDEIKDKDEFIKGTIMPDLNKEMTELSKIKNITHYGKWEKYQRKINFEMFLEDKNVKLNKDYWKGYLLHLLSDHYFYNKYFIKEYEIVVNNNDNFYYDSDCLNYTLMKKYEIEAIPTLERYMIRDKNKTKPKYLKIEKIIDFINIMSGIDLEKEIKIVKEKGTKGLI